MILVYKQGRKATHRGPYIHLSKGRAYRFDLGKPMEVPDDVGHEILSQVGDIVGKAPEPAKKKAVKKRAAKEAPRNKMLDHAPADK
jgi:hypothetical protein